MVSDASVQRLLGTWVARPTATRWQRTCVRVSLEFRADGSLRRRAVWRGPGSSIVEIQNFRYRIEGGLIVVELTTARRVERAGVLPTSGGSLAFTLDGHAMTLVRQGPIARALGVLVRLFVAA